MNTKTEFQEFVSRVTNFIVNDPSFKKYWQSAPYSKFLSENLRRYSEYTEDNKCIINNLDRMMQQCRMSQEAKDLIQRLGARKWDSGLNKHIHREHLFPVGEAVRQLGRLSVDPSEAGVEEILNKLELVLITKEQQRKLDKVMKSVGEPEERADYVGGVF